MFVKKKPQPLFCIYLQEKFAQNNNNNILNLFSMAQLYVCNLILKINEEQQEYDQYFNLISRNKLNVSNQLSSLSRNLDA